MRTAAVITAAAVAAGSASAQVQSEFDTPPDWVKRPTSGQFMEYWPTAALKRGTSGRVLMTCEVSTEGALRKCRVDEETPPGLGFGAAAVSLSTLYRFKPATKAGKPVATDVTIPIKFETPTSLGLGSHIPGAGRKVAVLTKPVWAGAPTRAEVDAAYPDGARKTPVRGAATLACGARDDGGLQGCRVEAEQPKGRGFGAAARTLVPRFRLAPLPPGAEVKMSDVRVTVPVQFDPPGSGAGDLGGARLLAKPNWVSLPTAQRIEASFPSAARAAGVKEGRAVVSCAVQSAGRLGDCSVASEAPEKLGFGASALLIADGFALSPWTEDGKPLNGTRLRVPIRFVDAGTESAATAAKP